MKLIRGFTLIELMVTITIMAIIATMAAPSFFNMIERQRLNRDTENLIAQLAQARSQAVALRRNVTVNLNSQAKDSDIVLNWSALGENKLTSKDTVVTFNSLGVVSNLAADTQFSICNSKLSVSRIFMLGRFGSLMILPDGVC